MADRDWIPGISFRGGDRNPTGDRAVGGTDWQLVWNENDRDIRKWMSEGQSFEQMAKWLGDKRTKGFDDTLTEVQNHAYYIDPNYGVKQQERRDENPSLPSGGYSTVSGGSFGPRGYTSADIASMENELSNTDRLLASLGVTRDTGMTNISREYDKNVGQARQAQDQFNRNQNISRQDNEANKVDALNRINTDTENKYNSVMQMLGVRGAGMSSAAQTLAPHLISQVATNQRADQFNTYGKNMRSIDLAQQDSDLNYSNLYNDLAEQKRQKEGNLRTSLVNQENDLYGTRAQIQSELDMARGGTGRAAYQDYNARLGRNQVTLDDLLREYQSPAYNYKAVDTAAPDMSKYTTDPLAVASAQQAQDPTAEDVNAYLPWLKRRKQDGLAGSY